MVFGLIKSIMAHLTTMSLEYIMVSIFLLERRALILTGVLVMMRPLEFSTVLSWYLSMMSSYPSYEKDMYLLALLPSMRYIIVSHSKDANSMSSVLKKTCVCEYTHDFSSFPLTTSCVSPFDKLTILLSKAQYPNISDLKMQILSNGMFKSSVLWRLNDKSYTCSFV